ncbi:MAG TPA: DMT family transporter [Burkholderiaceae bacterium]|nr:DMT family transporter [Burkholderiaceae bacterium]HQR70596.1 DMT family transporter [Burkholderiaceae bacterium]
MSGRLSPATAALLIAPPLFWAGNAVVARALVGEFPPLALSFARWALALLLILPLAHAGLREAWPRLRGHWPLLILISALGVGCYNSLQYLALQTSTAVNATLIAAAGPIVTLLVGAAFFGSPVRRPQWIGAALSMAGVLLVIARGDPLNLARLQLDRGDLIMLAATLIWSIYTWLLRTRRPQIDATPFLALQIALGALMILPFAALEYFWTGKTAAPTATNVAALLYVALLPSLVAYFCWDRGVARTGAVLPMYFVNLTPVFAGLLSWFLLGEAVGLFHLIGGALIVAGIHLASRPQRP